MNACVSDRMFSASPLSNLLNSTSTLTGYCTMQLTSLTSKNQPRTPHYFLGPSYNLGNRRHFLGKAQKSMKLFARSPTLDPASTLQQKKPASTALCTLLTSQYLTAYVRAILCKKFKQGVCWWGKTATKLIFFLHALVPSPYRFTTKNAYPPGASFPSNQPSAHRVPPSPNSVNFENRP